MDLLKLAKQFNIDVETIELNNTYLVIRSVGIKKLDQFREYLLSNGYDNPISTHRAEGTSEATMIVWFI